jgi:hypothetical protein
LAPPAAAAGGESGGPDVDVDTDPVSGERDVSTDIGGEGGHVTPHVTTTQAPGQQPELTGASVEVAGTRGNTHASVQVGADPSGAVTGQGEVTHRVSPNVAVGANAQVTNDHGEVHVAGGASLRLRLSDVTALRIAGGVDDQGMLNQEVALEILTDPSPRVPISDDAKRRLRFVIRAQEPTQVGQDPHAGLPNVSAGAVLTW